METISLALALPSGDIATGLLDLVEKHPLLEVCGLARTPADLARLLDLFHPDLLLTTPQMLRELADLPVPAEEKPGMPMVPCFLVLGSDFRAGKAEMVSFLQVPVAICGVVDMDSATSEELYLKAKERLSLLRCAVRPARLPGRDKDLGLCRNITLVGSKGGAGNTLLSASLAACLAGMGHRVLLMDLDRDRSQLLHLKPPGEGKSLLELLPLAEEMSWELVRISMYRHRAGFYLLPFGSKARASESQRVEVPDSLMRNFHYLFDRMIMDLPGNLVDDFLPILLTSDIVAIVSLADTISARCAREICVYLRRTGVEPRRLHLIVNRYGGNSSLQPHELSRAIGIEGPHLLPDDTRSGLDFAELGRLPRPESPLGKAVTSLARSLGTATRKKAGGAACTGNSDSCGKRRLLLRRR